jgi:methyltransferase (TIGR00027 family)
VGVAALRAAHQLLDAEPRILDDPVAFHLLDPELQDRLRGTPAAAAHATAQALRSHVVVRSRYAEDCLADAVGRGVTQYVILGAGLDTFAWRQPSWAASVRIYEVDQPATQHDKQIRLARAGLANPPNLTFVPVDFEAESLDARLHDAGVDRDLPVAFSWLGVMPYLNESAIDDVLRVIATCAAGSEVVLSFAPADESGRGPSVVEKMAAAVGELFRSHFTSEQLEGKLHGLGFSEVSFLTPADAAARYFAGRSDGLVPPRRTAIGRARV